MSTKELLLKEAETLARTRGYAAFSYADLAERVGIRKASIHHHFPTKEALGVALIDGYLAKFEAALAGVRANNASVKDRLLAYSAFFADSLRDGMMPLCAALSAETVALPDSMQSRVRAFFQLHLDWLEGVLRDGIDEGALRADLDAAATAHVLLSVLEGASLIAWALKDYAGIRPAFEQALTGLMARDARQLN